MKNILIYTCFLMLYASGNGFAQKLVNVTGKAMVRVENSHCIGDLKSKIVQMAQFDALAKKFGTSVRQDNELVTTSAQKDGVNSTSSLFNAISTSAVKGEWVKTQKEELHWILREEGPNEEQVLYLSCEVEGKAREINDASIDFEALTLKCDLPEQCATTMFEDNDDFFVSFKSPKKGYISIFMREEDLVYRLFPYSQMYGELASCAPIISDQEYVFFSQKYGNYFEGYTSRHVDPLRLSTGNSERIFNRVYIVYSETPFDKPIFDQRSDGLKVIEPEKFQQWLSKNKTANTSFQEKIIYMSVRK
ncbi:hypothetical protein AAG747_14950 [Rapidithrix thailandica]|uniref:DUF4384 domain-containing protein n=1 Tax=Rapidithrix thailandica TaxID=413964 RepID=A0AAW9S208_9BACT